MGMRSYPRFRQTFRGGAALECRFESCDSRTVHTSTRRTEAIVAGIHRGVQELRFSQTDTSNYAADIGILADVIITDGDASRKSSHIHDRGGCSIHPKIMGIP